MKTSAERKTFPAIQTELVELGESLRIARKRRRQTLQEVADRLNVGIQTVIRLEKGDPGVSVSTFMSVIWLFGLDRQVLAALSPDQDKFGKHLELARLPERVRAKKDARYDF